MSNTININTENNIPNAYKVKYNVTEEKYENNGKVRFSYGINAYYETNGTFGDTPCLSVCDISSEKEMVTAIVDSCNRLNASLEHIYEIIDDFFDVIEV